MGWKSFKRCTEIPNGQEADQLFDCCDKTLGRLILKENPEVIESEEEELLQALKRMAVIKIAACVRRTWLLTLKQDHGQSIREFYANVKAQAATCDFSVKCTQTCCNGKPAVDYTSLGVKDIIICGLSDMEIRKDVLEWTLTPLILLVSSKERKLLKKLGQVNQQMQLPHHAIERSKMSRNHQRNCHLREVLKNVEGKCLCKLEINLEGSTKLLLQSVSSVTRRVLRVKSQQWAVQNRNQNLKMQ